MAKVAGQALPLPKNLGVSLGIAPGVGSNDVRLAVRTTRQDPAVLQYVNTLALMLAGEVHVQHVGQISAGTPALGGVPWRGRLRPLEPGYSVCHYRGTAGTIGGFVDRAGAAHLLSNNHVLALSAGVTTRAQHNDPVTQPGPTDGGAHPVDSIGRVAGWVPLAPGVNYVDSALAVLDYDAGFNTLYAGIRLAGVGPASLGLDAWKVGRTSGVTTGRFTAVGLDDVPVNYGGQTLYFDDQLEVEGAGGLFSGPGDSGSLVMTADNFAVGLLFAGSSVSGKTFANQLELVLQLLGATLLV